MALMIKDAAGIYTEAEPPLAYDPVLEAYRDTEGLVHDNTLEAWKKVWPEYPEVLHLYGDGDECTYYTGGWNPYPYRFDPSAETNGPRAPGVTRTDEKIILSEPAGYFRGSFFSELRISMSQYSVLKVHVVSACAKSNAGYNPYDYKALAFISITDEKEDAFEPEVSADIIRANDIMVQDVTVGMDVSGITGKRYIAFGFMSVASDMTIEFDKIWLE